MDYKTPLSWDNDELIYQISLTQIPGVGEYLAKLLVSYCGSAKGVFTEKKSFLLKIPEIGDFTAHSISKFKHFDFAVQEIELLKANQITPIFYLDEKFPAKLKVYDDSPILMYYKGNANLNHQRIISIVGTRKSTAYGKQFTDDLISELAKYDVMVISGLAFGTDTNAHKACVKNNVTTVGVLGHGFHTLFPSSNKKLSEEMILNGGLLTEYNFSMPGNKENFPKRNRIVAGMSDAIIVVESAIKGGSLITADIANSYDKDIYALPGRINDPYSLGCNKLLYDHKASIIDSIPGLIFSLGYQKNKPNKQSQQMQMDLHLSADEKLVYNELSKGEQTIDDLFFYTKISVSKLALVLLDLEFKNLVKSLPGKKYALAYSMG